MTDELTKAKLALADAAVLLEEVRERYDIHDGANGPPGYIMEEYDTLRLTYHKALAALVEAKNLLGVGTTISTHGRSSE